MSVMLIFTVGFTNEAKAYQINDGIGEIVKSEVVDVTKQDAPMVVASNTTAIDNVEVVVSSVNNLVASAVNSKEVGGSIVSSDANLPDQDNLIAISNSKVNYGLWLLSKRKVKRLIASVDNFNSVTNDKVGDITSNVGKSSTSSWNTTNYIKNIS